MNPQERIKEIKHKENCVYGWNMRIMQAEEDIFGIEKMLKEYKKIRDKHEEELLKLRSKQ